MEKKLIINKIIAENGAEIYYCPITESLICNSEDLNLKLPETFCEKRKKEIISIHYIIRSVTDYKGNIQYLTSGEPVIPDFGRFISISHSEFYAAVMISPVKCGVDVEKISGRIEKVAHKFLCEHERLLIKNINRNFYHTLLWSAKESLFKITGQPDFLMSYRTVLLPQENHNFFEIEQITETIINKFRLFYTTFDEHVLTWTYEE